MLPLLPFLAGVALGAVGVSAVRSGRAAQTLHQVGDQLRDAAHSGGEQLRSAAHSGQELTRAVWSRAAAVAPATAPEPAAPPAAAAQPAPRKRSASKKPKKAST